MLTDTKVAVMARRKPKKRPVNRSIPTPTPRTLDVRHRPPPVELAKRDVLNVKRPQPDLRPVEDLRHDNPDQTFRTRSGRPARTINRPQGEVQKSRLYTPVYTYFQNPERVLVCIRREARKRVLFALQRAGKGKRVSRERHYTDKSYVRCK